MQFLSYIPAFLVTMVVLVTAHEFGHFISGRIFGMHVPVFSVGMGRRLFGWSKLFGFSFGTLKAEQEAQLGIVTDYRVSLLPIGGYAKIDGMIDETQTEELSPEVQPWEFRAKPWWQKSIVLCAGVIMNLLVATLIFTGFALRNGDTREATRTVGYVLPHSTSAEAGVKPGDRVLSLGGTTIRDWSDLRERLLDRYLGREFAVQFETSAGIKTVDYPALDLNKIGDEDFETKLLGTLGVAPQGFGRVYIDSAIAEPARSSGLRSGDLMMKVGDDSVGDRVSLISLFARHKHQPVQISWLRNGEIMSTGITPDTNGHIGVQVGETAYTGPIEHYSYSVFSAVPIGIKHATTRLSGIVRGIWAVVTGKIPVGKSLGGPIKIFQLAGKSASSGGQSFLFFIALLSLSLAFLNLLPIPALDGGHLMIILIEAAIHRELSQKFKMGFQRVGVALILTLMLFMVFNDIRNL